MINLSLLHYSSSSLVMACCKRNQCCQYNFPDLPKFHECGNHLHGNCSLHVLHKVQRSLLALIACYPAYHAYHTYHMLALLTLLIMFTLHTNAYPT